MPDFDDKRPPTVFFRSSPPAVRVATMPAEMSVFVPKATELCCPRAGFLEGSAASSVFFFFLACFTASSEVSSACQGADLGRHFTSG